ncbi:hypothetical protein BC826DRAFT_991846 [Russula brevipes]|nr:hypothetical protein BC826DRAFT_991846 [Russula brevipes]
MPAQQLYDTQGYRLTGAALTPYNTSRRTVCWRRVKLIDVFFAVAVGTYTSVGIKALTTRRLGDDGDFCVRRRCQISLLPISLEQNTYSTRAPWLGAFTSRPHIGSPIRNENMHDQNVTATELDRKHQLGSGITRLRTVPWQVGHSSLSSQLARHLLRTTQQVPGSRRSSTVLGKFRRLWWWL